MNDNGTPQLDDRDAAAVVQDALSRLPAYVPGWFPSTEGPGWAIIQIYARYLQALIERLDQVPDKNKLAFLDQLGINLLPAQAARAPLVFQAIPEIGNSRVPAGTRVGANVPGLDQPLIFETETAIALVSSHLVEVVTLFPGQDAYGDYSTALTTQQPFTLFDRLQPVPHILYLAHDTHLALAGKCTVELEVELVTPGNLPLHITWEYWDGGVWRGFKEFQEQDQSGESFDGTNGFTRSSVLRLAADCAETTKTIVNGVETYWIRGRLLQVLPPDPHRVLPLVDRIRVRTVIDRSVPAPIPGMRTIGSPGLPLDTACSDSFKLDLSKTFYPFGQQAQAGNVFYLSSEEVFSKPGASVAIDATREQTPQDNTGDGASTVSVPPLVLEYWNGQVWQPLSSASLPDFVSQNNSNRFSFNLPTDLAKTTVNNTPGFWLRIKITSGGFVRTRTIQWTDGASPAPQKPVNKVVVIENVPPAFSNLFLSYLYRSSWALPQYCLTYNDFQYSDQSEKLRSPGTSFPIYSSVSDSTPALYLGFDQPLPADLVSLYLAIQEQEGLFRGPLLIWEFWDGTTWQSLTVTDQTANLCLPGMVTLIGVPDSPALARFGTARYWVRARLREDGTPIKSALTGIYLNAAWAAQHQTFTNEVVGSSAGQPNQSFFTRYAPVLPGQVVEVRELEGARAEVELPILTQELLQQGLTAADIRTVTDPRTGRVNQVWVRWQERPNFFFSTGSDRHYLIERSRGRLIFGGNQNGRIPVAGADNIRINQYQAGGGTVSNVSINTITQLLSGVLVQKVSNLRAGEGGADGEPAQAVLSRGPRTLRHRRQAVSLTDYEALAREASPAVAVARALPTTHPSGRPAPGWVKVIIMPHSQDAQPQPSFELRRQVQLFLQARSPAAITSQITVTGPDYLPIGVSVVVAPANPEEAGVVGERVQQALFQFLHPLTGGPEGAGWSFGRDVYLSDVSAILERVSGVDYITELLLLLDDTPKGEFVPVPADRIVIAGLLRIRLQLAERV